MSFKLRVQLDLTDKQVVIALAKADGAGYTYANPRAKAALLAVLREYLRDNGVPWENVAEDEINDGNIRKAIAWAEVLGLRPSSLRAIEGELA